MLEQVWPPTQGQRTVMWLTKLSVNRLDAENDIGTCYRNVKT